MVSPCHKVSTELLTLAGPSKDRSDSRASGRYGELKYSWQGVRSDQHGAQALSNVGLRSTKTLPPPPWGPEKEGR